MARPYSDDLRSKFVTAYETGNIGLKKLAATFQVSRAWAERILRTKRSTGSSSRPAGRPRGFPSRLTPEVRQRLGVQIGKQPDATVNELRGWLQTQENVAISQQRLSAVIIEMGLRVKKSLHASEQDSAEGVRRREQWRAETADIDPERLVFLDECGVTTDRTRLHGRAPRGQREATGAKLLYLPPYSPDFNPIELCWSVVKQRLRHLKARSVAALNVALPEALTLISPKIAQNFFRHCAYALC